MSIFKCKMCGGTLEFNQGETVGVCDHCGTKQTLPKLDDEKRVQLYDRANHFRRENEFDKAMGIYEMILAEDREDAEAYWGIVLCKYGIEYVEDPRSHKRIPTVNRAQYTSVFDDKDYLSAIQHADGYQRDIYEEEARAIDAIQKGILEISAKEEPFDVFICYKETDELGNRTQDSVYAQELYNALKKEGYKVFFARITLENKLGQQYEPFIFAALHSAKVMLVVGTSKDNFNAVWVKNEWSRFLALSKEDSSKVIIPCYKDISPYNMPEEFTYLQSQDMGKIGYIQDILHGIEKFVKKETVKETVVVSGGNTNTAPLLKRAFMFLEDGDWQSADEYCEKVLDIDPENGEAYLGKLMAELRVKNFDSFKDTLIPIYDKPNYEKAMRFGNEEIKSELISLSEQISENIYKSATDLMEHAKYEKAVESFMSITRYKDAVSLAETCRSEIQKITQTKNSLKALKSDLFKKKKALSDFDALISGAEKEETAINTSEFKFSESEEKHFKLLRVFAIIGLCFSAILLIPLISTKNQAEDLSVSIAASIVLYVTLSLLPSLLKLIGWIQLKRLNCINGKEIAIRGVLSAFFPITSSIIAFVDIYKGKKAIKQKQKQTDLDAINTKKSDAQQRKEKLIAEIDSINSDIEQKERFLNTVAEKSGEPILEEDDELSEADELYPKALEIVIEAQNASTTLLQNKLGVGYARAARLVEELEVNGIIGPFEGSKPRKVLISKQQWYEMNALASGGSVKETEPNGNVQLDDIIQQMANNSVQPPSASPASPPSTPPKYDKKQDRIVLTRDRESFKNLYISRLKPRNSGEGRTYLYVDGLKVKFNTDISFALKVPLGVHTVQFKRAAVSSDVIKLDFNDEYKTYSLTFNPKLFKIDVDIR